MISPRPWASIGVTHSYSSRPFLCTLVTTNTLKTYLSAHPSYWVPLWSARLVKLPKALQKTAKPKVCGSKSAIFYSFFLVKTTMFNNDISKNGYPISTHSQFSTKFDVYHSFKFTLVNKSHTQHSDSLHAGLRLPTHSTHKIRLAITAKVQLV